MLFDEILEKLSNKNSKLFLETVSTPRFDKKIYSKLLPEFNYNFTISHARNVKSCLNIKIDEVDYYLIESNVLYKKNIETETKKIKRKFFGIHISYKIKTTNEKDIISLFEKTKNELIKDHKNIDYYKYYDIHTGSVFYYFILKTYFITTNKKIEEVQYNDLKKIKNKIKKKILEEKQEVLNLKFRKFLKLI